VTHYATYSYVRTNTKRFLRDLTKLSRDGDLLRTKGTGKQTAVFSGSSASECAFFYAWGKVKVKLHLGAR